MLSFMAIVSPLIALSKTIDLVKTLFMGPQAFVSGALRCVRYRNSIHSVSQSFGQIARRLV